MYIHKSAYMRRCIKTCRQIADGKWIVYIFNIYIENQRRSRGRKYRRIWEKLINFILMAKFNGNTAASQMEISFE